MYRIPNMKNQIRGQLQPKSFATSKEFPKTPTEGLMVHCQADDRLYVGDGKKWVVMNTGPEPAAE